MAPDATCRNCGESLAAEDAYCPACGTQVADKDRTALASRRRRLSDSSLVDGKCRSCNGPLRSTDVFCPECGARRGPSTGSTATARSANWRKLRERLEEVASEEYEILEELGRGGMGAVYLARERALDRPVAIKVLFPRFLADESMLERFRNEARIVAALRHPSIVGVHAVRHLEDLHFFVMNYIEGASLEKLVRTHGPLPVPVVKAVLYQVGNALAYAHRQGRGVIHRDIKPSNIMLDTDGTAILTDFGISKAVNRSQGLTMTGAIIGTPEYMSPEQCRGDTLSTASDQYSLGLVGYVMLTGHPPFSGPHYAVLLAHLQESPPSIREVRPDCPEDLEAAILRMLGKLPDQRFGDVREGLRAFGGRPVEHGDPVRQEIVELLRAAGAKRWRAASVAEVSISQPPRVVVPGDRFVLEAVPMDELGQELPDRDVAWTSTDPGVVSTFEDGSFQAVAEGRAFLLAVCEGREARVEVVVDRAPVAELRVADAPPGLHPGDRFRLDAVPLRADGSELAGRDVSWASSDPEVAFVTSGGSVEAVGPGRTVITAECEGRRAAVEVDVLPPPVARLWISGAPALLNPGDEFTLDVAALDRKGVRLEGRTVTWEVQPADVLVVLGGGRFRAAAEGEAEIVAGCEGREARAAVRVLPEPRATVVTPRPEPPREPEADEVPTILRPTAGSGAPGPESVDEGGPELPPDVGALGEEVDSSPPEVREPSREAVAPPPNVDGPVGDVAPPSSEVEDPADGAVGTGGGRKRRPSPALWLGAAGVAAVVAVGFFVLGSDDDSTPVDDPGTASVAAVAVSPAELRMDVGDSTRLAAAARTADGELVAEASLTWGLEGSGGGTVIDLGTDGTVRALGPGSVTVAARSGDAVGRGRVIVEAAGEDDEEQEQDLPDLAEIAIQGSGAAATEGDIRTYNLVARDAEGAPWAFQPGQVTWRSSDPSVVSVTGGRAQARAPGAAWVVATLAGQSDSLRLQVRAADPVDPDPPGDEPEPDVPVATVVVIGGAPDGMDVGDATPLVGTVRDADGAPMDRSVTWTSSDPAVVDVDPTGVIEARGAGSATVVATFGELADSVTVEVRAAGATPPSAQDAAAAAAAWTGILTSRDLGRITALIGTVDGDHEEMLDIVREESREFRAANPREAVITDVDGETATMTFVVSVSWRTPFGPREGRDTTFRAGLTWRDGAWVLTSCRLADGFAP